MSLILFLDDWALSSRRNVVRRMGRPEWVPEATLEESITEGTWNFPFVHFDRERQRWIALYSGVDFVASKRRSLGLLFAESADGIHWERPDLAERVCLPGRIRTNQVLLHDPCDGGPAFYDPVDPDPGRRFKFLFADRRARVRMLATSPDGLLWQKDLLPWGEGHLDAPITAFYNHLSGHYTIVSRPGLTDRRVALTHTVDFRTFSEARLALQPDAEDPPLLQFYGMPVHRYEDLYIGLLWRYHTSPEETGWRKLKGEVDCALAYSYDGRHFIRFTHEAFIPRNLRGEYGGGCLYPAAMVVDETPQIRFYSGASKTGHFQTPYETDAALLLHTLRLDGFGYLESRAVTGLVSTRCIRLGAAPLRLNVRAPYGAIRVQLSGEDGEALPGYSYTESVPFTGDSLFYEPQWRSGQRVEELAGQPVRIDIELTRAELYAVRGEFELLVAGPGG